jgi:medium-chain acyl-[acyl-carrier-protein] hydrolase
MNASLKPPPPKLPQARRNGAYLFPLHNACGKKSRMQLYLFPYAGASAAIFRGWAARFDDRFELIAIQLPGRANRFSEPPVTCHRQLFEEVTDAIVERMAERIAAARFAFYGHSMGALLAFEVTLELARRGARQPECLFLSGRKPPHLPVTRVPVKHMSDVDFLDELKRMEGTPPELLANNELMRLLLPTVKADFALLDGWHANQDPSPARPCISLPIYAMAGRRDNHCRPEQASGWQDYTRGPSEVLEYNGGHFFLQSHEAQVTRDTCERLESFLGGA